MIFITVGTHEQQFNRLLEYVDSLICEGIIKDTVFAQIGYSTYSPKYYDYTLFCSYKEMQDNIKNANICITHGGPSSFFEVLSYNKVPIVVPRQKKYKEHINNHQLDFCKYIEKEKGIIRVADNYDQLRDIISSFDNAELNNTNYSDNTEKFNQNLETLIKKIL